MAASGRGLEETKHGELDPTRSKCTYKQFNTDYANVRTPGNRLLVQYKKKKVAAPTTPKYHGGKALQGLKRIRPSRRTTCGASAKRVSRPYGGVLSYDLVRERIVRAFLIEEQKIVKRVLKMKKVKTAPTAEKAAEK